MKAAAAKSFQEGNAPTLGKSASQDGTPVQYRHKTSPESPSGVWEFFLPPTSRTDNKNENRAVHKRTFSINDDRSDCQTIISEIDLAPVPERLVDFVCIVGPKLDAIRHFAETPSDVHLEPILMDCYPKQRNDMELPKELPKFCLPQNCRLTTPYDIESLEPTLSSFVLTMGNGNRLYGTALTQYEVIPLEDLAAAFWAGNSILPHWLEEPQPFYLPKSLVVFSHHALFDVQRNFLLQLCRIVSSKRSPLPLERYVANFFHDVPLPKPGAATVSWKPFLQDAPVVTFARPGPNELPLVNISFRPLFRCLSVSNILTVWGILLQEGRVVLRSEHIALLTPVAEALMSLLFPLAWQGVYVPVLPAEMIGVLEAPVPFLIGLLVGSNACPQPPGVVVCDLDQDIVHLGATDDGFPSEPRKLPQLPTVLVATLKSELDDVADPLYLIPPSGMKGRITAATHGLLENAMREPYAQMFQMRNVSLSNTHRQHILYTANFVRGDKQLLKESDFLRGPDEEQTLYKSMESKKTKTPGGAGGNFMFSAIRRQGRALQAHTDRVISYTSSGAAYYDDKMSKQKDIIAASFYELDEKLAESVRYSFLRFFASLFGRYKKYTPKKRNNGGSGFQHADFVNSLEEEMSYGNRLFVLEVVQTQMFERFLTESHTRRRLFDEYILLQQNNESSVLAKKHETPFLKQKNQIQKIVVPAAPCTAGIPKNTLYEYDSFPFSLNEEEMVANRNLDPVSALCYLGDLTIGGPEKKW
ncbi:DENN AEX-3 domain containing protein [Nitzschia inconspicua]|uniref:DENN AEX-3 domain containing protein n=1 Tax=Nitzschia inconspicua TaxID=303405 RepID=A0A9K3KD99_9STRA|nr:DENN AEX-3 domain containing protein [Nitzschia inconspicua]